MDYKTFKEKYNIRLNAQQESAVMRTEGQTLLLAVPGSGKTSTMIARLGYMVLCKGISPENILVISYTQTSHIKNRCAA